MDSLTRQRLREISQNLLRVVESASPESAMGGVDPEFLKGLAGMHTLSESNDVAQAMAQLANRFAHGERAFVLLVSEDNRLKFAAGENVTSEQLAGGIPVAKTIIQQALTSTEIVADDFENRSIVCIPILYFPPNEQEAVHKLGLLYLDRGFTDVSITDLTLELLESVVDHGATALVKLKSTANQSQVVDTERVKQLEAQVRETTELKNRLSKITEIGREISSTLDLESLFVKIVDYLIEMSGAQRGFMMLVEGDEPVYKIGRNFRKMTIPLEHFQFSRSVAHSVITEKQPKVIVVSSTDDFDPSRSMVAMKLNSVLCIPLMEKDNVLGLVYLDSQQQAKEFNEADAEFLQSLCGQAAVALLNAKLLKDATEKERIRSELDLAAEIQLELLPRVDPEVAGLEIRGKMIPAKEVGGDYYDFIPHVGTQDSLTVAIGDVSGKGVGAGLVMIMARSIIRSAVFQAGVPKSTAEIMRNLNTLFCADLRKGMFMTLNICNWWSATRTLTYTGAGHEHIIVYRAQTSTVECKKAGGVATGVLTAANNMYQEQAYQLNEGDMLLLYTDGVTEAMNEEYEEWGLDNLKEAVQQHGDKTPLDLINTIIEKIRKFRGRAEQNDDITMVAMKAKPQIFMGGDVSSQVEDLLADFG